MERELIWLILSRARGVGRVRMARLMEAYPDPADAWQLSAVELTAIEGFNKPAAHEVVAIRQSAQARREAEAEWEAARQAGLRLVAAPDLDYPVRLRQIPDPPPFFYQVGPWQPDDRPVVAIVGTRRPTAYGLSIAERMGRELAAAGAVVVSGMARGIDCAAHRGALSAGGATVAVLGGGADVCYPREAAPLYKAIRTTGAILSEQPPGTPPRPENFPERNRIISGLAHGIVVVEAGEHSGTLITVREGLRQGRDVFAVPGPVTSPVSLGPHQLIQDGAGLVTTAREVLAALETVIESPTALRTAGSGKARPGPGGGAASLSPVQERILGWMGDDPRWADDLAVACGLAVSEIQAVLTMLELRGLLRLLPSGQYVRNI